MTEITERANIHKNADGLRVAMGLEEGKRVRVASPRQAGSLKVIECDILSTDMAAFSVNQLINNTPTAAVPDGALLVEAKLTIIEAFDSAADALTLTLGMTKQNGTDIDLDGIDVAIAQGSIDAVGDVITCDGALINTLMTADAYPTVRANVATATAGKAKLILTYMPVADLG